MQAGQASQSRRRPKGKSFWLMIAGAAMIFVGVVMASLIFFALGQPPSAGVPFGYASSQPYLDPRVAYNAAGIGYILAGVGSFLALLGIAFRGRR
jgi:hypothetical protein